MRRLGRTAATLFADLPSPQGLLPLVVALIAWQLTQPATSPYFPPPTVWWHSLVDLAAGGRLAEALVATLVTVGLGLSLATVGGAGLGVLLGLSRTASRMLQPALEFCRATPPAAVVPLAILFIGYDERMKLAIVAVSASWPILLNTVAAVREIHPVLLDVGRSLHLSPLARARSIVLPSAVPAILLGVRVALPLAIILAILVEILTSIEGVGALMIAAQRNYQAGQVYALLVVVGIVGFVLNAAFTIAQAAILKRWPPRLVAL